MKTPVLPLCLLLLSGCGPATQIKRTHLQPYEQDIGYTQVVQHGNLLYLSGVAVSGPDMQQAVNTAYAIIGDVLEQHGSGFEWVVKETVFTTDMAALKAQIETRKAHYPSGKYPSSSWVEVSGLFMPQLILEVEVVAVIPGH